MNSRNYFHNNNAISDFKQGVNDFVSGCVSGSKNMIGIAIATAAAGIIVGTITLTGVGLIMAELVDFLSGGNLLIMLFFTAIVSLVLGMGLPTTANYIVVSSLMAPVIITVGAENGLIVPLIAVHLFVFYFGILADDTPPVGLAAYAASAISGGNPIRTGVQGFKYDIRTAILPFMFIFNTELLLIDITSVWHLIMVVASALVGMLVFASGTQGFWLTKNKIWETILMLLITWILFLPGFFMNFISDEFKQIPKENIWKVAQYQDNIKIKIEGVTLEGNMVNKVVRLPLTNKNDESAQDKLKNTGLEIDDRFIVQSVKYDSIAYKQKIEQGNKITGVIVKNDRIDKHWFYLLAILFLSIIWLSQTRRLNNEK